MSIKRLLNCFIILVSGIGIGLNLGPMLKKKEKDVKPITTQYTKPEEYITKDTLINKKFARVTRLKDSIVQITYGGTPVKKKPSNPYPNLTKTRNIAFDQPFMGTSGTILMSWAIWVDDKSMEIGYESLNTPEEVPAARERLKKYANQQMPKLVKLRYL